MKKEVLLLFIMLCLVAACSTVCAQAQRSQHTATRNITGRWSCASKERVTNQFGEKFPSWIFDLKLKVENNQIKGDYLVSCPLHERFDGNLYSGDEEDFDIKGKWVGDKYIVKYESSWGANVTAYIKPITSRKIEWRIISEKGGCTMAPKRAILTKER